MEEKVEIQYTSQTKSMHEKYTVNVSLTPHTNTSNQWCFSLLLFSSLFSFPVA